MPNPEGSPNKRYCNIFCTTQLIDSCQLRAQQLRNYFWIPSMYFSLDMSRFWRQSLRAARLFKLHRHSRLFCLSRKLCLSSPWSRSLRIQESVWMPRTTNADFCLWAFDTSKKVKLCLCSHRGSEASNGLRVPWAALMALGTAQSQNPLDQGAII